MKAHGADCETIDVDSLWSPAENSASNFDSQCISAPSGRPPDLPFHCETREEA